MFFLNNKNIAKFQYKNKKKIRNLRCCFVGNEIHKFVNDASNRLIQQFDINKLYRKDKIPKYLAIQNISPPSGRQTKIQSRTLWCWRKTLSASFKQFVFSSFFESKIPTVDIIESINCDHSKLIWIERFIFVVVGSVNAYRAWYMGLEQSNLECFLSTLGLVCKHN